MAKRKNPRNISFVEFSPLQRRRLLEALPYVGASYESFILAATLHAVDEVHGLAREEQRQRTTTLDQWKHEIAEIEKGTNVEPTE